VPLITSLVLLVLLLTKQPLLNRNAFLLTFTMAAKAAKGPWIDDPEKKLRFRILSLEHETLELEDKKGRYKESFKKASRFQRQCIEKERKRQAT
jgi:hypothetical protein